MKKAQILLVDDDESILEIHAAHLIKEGYEVTLANDGFEALRKLSLKKFDLIVADYIMPTMDGIQFSHYIRVNTMNESTPVFILSGHLNNNVIDSFKKLGIIKFLAKPCSIGDLLKAIRNKIQPPSKIANYTSEMIEIMQKTILGTFEQYYKKNIKIPKHEIIKTSTALSHYSSTIPFFGKSIFGYSSLYADRASLKGICQKAFGTTESDFGEPTYLDILGESNNQILGNLKHVMHARNIDLIIGLPISIAGHSRNISLLPTFPRILFDVLLNENRIFVEYCISDPAKIELLQTGAGIKVFEYSEDE